MKIGLVPAAGMARRLNISMPKELLKVEGKPVISYCIESLLASDVDHIVVVIRSGKEAIRDFLLARYPSVSFEFVYQQGDIGNLLDAIKCAADLISDHTVCFTMPDTIITPKPGLPLFAQPSTDRDLQLLCFEAADDSWRHFGVIDVKDGNIVDKPKRWYGNTCWGALIWQPAFTERLKSARDFTLAMNAVSWDYRVAIEQYRDIGVYEALDAEQLMQIRSAAAS